VREASQQHPILVVTSSASLRSPIQPFLVQTLPNQNAHQRPEHDHLAHLDLPLELCHEQNEARRNFSETREQELIRSGLVASHSFVTRLASLRFARSLTAQAAVRRLPDFPVPVAEHVEEPLQELGEPVEHRYVRNAVQDRYPANEELPDVRVGAPDVLLEERDELLHVESFAFGDNVLDQSE